jgi:prevent-host-death family protein
MNIAEAKAKLSELVARAEAGEEVIIARDGKPIVALTPRGVRPAKGRRTLGVWDHLGRDIPQDLFLGPDPETEASLVDWMDAPIEPAA